MLWKALLCSPLLASVALAAPTAEGQSLEAFNETEIVARGGNHQAVVYSAEECTGEDIDYVYNFGCGGTCHTGYNRKILSVLLKQDTTKNPKPTALFYAGPGCTGRTVASAGIFKGGHSGCTTLPEEGSQSFYLYWDC